ncbi:hypothetical protein GCK72_012013 [Caenorhabditis remanei]|uniref:Domain of unknown function WSN domain-containing protein n=1 Tax=Caenorhabditis remanei TaxID=31234 RepID=A0A6A5GLK8_CAERE|nr:hypothetical protein GCK72_012013 [Caenorhabditis remanei]KAF1755563.1 hypothetical protein GCK72_012013 [Caenorhabditis remanei]
MRQIFILSLISLTWLGIPTVDGNHFLESGDVVTMIKSEFPLTKHDALTLDELNTLRRLIADGYIGNILKGLEKFIIAAGKVVAFIEDSIEKAWDAITLVYTKVSSFEGWGELAVQTGNIIMDVALRIEDGVTELAEGFIDFASDVGGAISDFFGKRRRRNKDINNPLGHSGNSLDFRYNTTNIPQEETEFHMPSNTLGPAADMNILVWNRRLAQLASIKRNLFHDGQRDTVYEGKKYRMFKFGGYLEYIIGNFLGKVISGFFKWAKVAYYACYLILSGIDAPIFNKAAIEDSIHEALYANSMEVGCVVAIPDSYCIIGPVKDRHDNMFYEPGKPASKCHYGSNSSLCTPPPSYFFALRDKYEGRLRPKISKFEIVDGFNASDNSTVDEFSVEWPDDDDASFGFSPLFFVILFLISIIFGLNN